ncbi:MAG: triose-phosphate isomerase [Rhodospirillaceae bacterium TMED8]|nr:triose-phosphate isomerase [Magnetovibrio sp.]OUT51646.1 MAG: triose-phosphate isomerase [Rhodospirillaceae bacterium TMED8]
MPAKRHALIAGNWKMNGLKNDARLLAGGIANRMAKVKKAPFEVVVCPPTPLIGLVVEIVKGKGVSVGGQDCHANVSGAHTGDTSAALLKSMGCKYTIVGHSERRTDHRETDENVREKAVAAHAAGLTAIICIGETFQEYADGKSEEVNKRQLKSSLPEDSNAKNTVIAYEPVWAIGTGKVATPEQAQEVHALIRNDLAKLIGNHESQKIRILYGGSMKPSNALDLLALPDVDGGLIGGASLEVSDFWKITQAISS